MPAPLVFFDIAGPDLASQSAFYRTVFGWDVGADGHVMVPTASPVPALLRVETAPALVAERVIYLGVEDITATLAMIGEHGGSTVFPRTVVPGVVILSLFKDPAGNRMGLVEIRHGKPVVPPPA
jgi:predicted enzyme related to lactoylglutathione lyase